MGCLEAINQAWIRYSKLNHKPTYLICSRSFYDLLRIQTKTYDCTRTLVECYGLKVIISEGLSGEPKFIMGWEPNA